MNNHHPEYKEAAPMYWAASWKGVLPLPPALKFPPPKDWTGFGAPYPSWADIQDWLDNGFNAKIKVAENEWEYKHFTADKAGLGLHLPNTVVGIDVDQYGKKQGARTLAHAESLWGPLPPTHRSTSRLDDASGIRLYRVPAGTELNTVIRFQVGDQTLADVEVCQFFHRYVVAWPTIHPDTGRRYHWVNPEGAVTADIPRPYKLPDLPLPWLEGLRRKASSEITASGDVAKVLASLPGGPMSPAVQSTLAKGLSGLMSGGSRHDATLTTVGLLFRLAERGGESGIQQAFDTLGKAWVTAVTKDGSRSADEARLEWDRMMKGNRIHDLIASTPSVPTLQDLLGKKPAPIDPGLQNLPVVKHSVHNHDYDPSCTETMSSDGTPVGACMQPLAPKVMDPVLEAIRTHYDTNDVSTEIEAAELTYHDPGADSLAFLLGESPGDRPTPILMPTHYPDPFDTLLMAEEDGVTAEARTTWGALDLNAILDGDLSPEEPTVLERADGKTLMYSGHVNALVGESESGKSWCAFLACAQEIAKGNSVVLIDFEDTPKNVISRFLAMHVPVENLRRQFAYIQPDCPMGPVEQEELDSVVGRMNPTVIVIDGVNAAMTLLGLDLEKNTDCTRFHQLILKPLTITGAAVIIVDHVTKSADNRGKYAIGAQAKRAMIEGVMIGVRCIETFGRGMLGELELVVLKDKPGSVRGLSERRGKMDYLASAIMDARTEGEMNMKLILEADNTGDDTMPRGEKNLIVKMHEVSRYLQECEASGASGVSQVKIKNGVPGREVNVLAALNELVAMGYVRRSDGARGSQVHTTIRPYHGPDGHSIQELLED